MSRPLGVEFPGVVVVKRMKCDNEKTNPSWRIKL
jgi:hypothetical protein